MLKNYCDMSKEEQRQVDKSKIDKALLKIANDRDFKQGAYCLSMDLLTPSKRAKFVDMILDYYKVNYTDKFWG